MMFCKTVLGRVSARILVSSVDLSGQYQVSVQTLLNGLKMQLDEVSNTEVGCDL